MNTAPSTTPVLTTGTLVTIVKGFQARDITKGSTAVVTVIPLGKEYGYSVKVTLTFVSGSSMVYQGRAVSFYARHPNRLSDPVVRMNDGNPLHTIEVRRA